MLVSISALGAGEEGGELLGVTADHVLAVLHLSYILYTIYYILYTMLYTIYYVIYYILCYILYNMLYTIHYVIYYILCTIYLACYILYTVHYTPYTIYYIVAFVYLRERRTITDGRCGAMPNFGYSLQGGAVGGGCSGWG